MKDLYSTLGLARDASAKEIKKAYFDLAKKYHPDTGTAVDLKKFYAITESYQILSDTTQKKAYDATYKENRIEQALIHDVMHPGGAPKTPIKSPRDMEFRQSEVQRFRRELLLKAAFRVAGVSFLATIFGYFYSLLFAGSLFLGSVFGFSLGFSWSVYQNFNVDSFVAKATARKRLRLIHYSLIGISVFYFLLILVI